METHANCFPSSSFKWSYCIVVVSEILVQVLLLKRLCPKLKDLESNSLDHLLFRNGSLVRQTLRNVHVCAQAVMGGQEEGE